MISCRSPQYRRKSITPRTGPWGTLHTMEQGDEEDVAAGLTGRIETIVVLIPQSDRNSPVDAE